MSCSSAVGAGHVDGDATVGPLGNRTGDEGTTEDCHDNDHDHDDRHGLVLAATPPVLGEGVQHFIEEAGGVACRVPDVLHLRIGVPGSHGDVAEGTTSVSVDQAVRPDAEAAADDGEDDDEVAELHRHRSPLGSQPLHGNGDHGQDRQDDPGEAAAGHDQTTPHDEPGPPADDLALGQVCPRGVGVPDTDRGVEHQEPDENEPFHFHSFCKRDDSRDKIYVGLYFVSKIINIRN